MFEALFAYCARDAFNPAPACLALEGLAPAQLLAQGYDRVGDALEFHLYEKPGVALHNGRERGVRLKFYFDAGHYLGPGLELGKGLRLTSLLACYRRLKGREGVAQGDVQVYFFDQQRKEGALIIEGSIVIRFAQHDRRAGYQVGTLERDTPQAGADQPLATFMVKRSMRPLALESVSARRTGNRAFERLRCALADATGPSSSCPG